MYNCGNGNEKTLQIFSLDIVIQCRDLFLRIFISNKGYYHCVSIAFNACGKSAWVEQYPVAKIEYSMQ